MTKHKVLIPLDGSEFSRQIVRVVRTFFDPNDVQLVLFRAAFPPNLPPETTPHEVFVGGMPVSASYDAYSKALDTEYESIAHEREGYRTALLEEMRVDAESLQTAGYSVQAEVHFGDPGQRIVDYVNSGGIDLVAMVTHGRTGLGRLVLGSVAERVLHGVSVPVLLMRAASEPERVTPPGEKLAGSLGDGRKLRIAVATDGSTLAQRAVSKAGELAQMLDAKLSLLVAVSDRNELTHSQRIMEEATQLIAHLHPKPDVVPLVGYVDEEVLHHLANNPMDLLVIGPFHDRGAGSATAIGATAQRLVQHAPTSIFVHKGHQPSMRKLLACVAVDDTVVVDVAAQLAKASGAELTLVHVVPPTAASYLSSSDPGGDESDIIALREVLAQGTRLSSLLRDWIAQLEEQGLTQDVVVMRRGAVPEAILKMAHDGAYDLIVVGSQSGPGRFLGSVANGVVRFAEQSVLVVRTRAL